MLIPSFQEAEAILIICVLKLFQKKEKYPYIKRIYVCAEYPYIDEDYENFLLERYEETYFPEKLTDAGRAVYVERNCEMIDKADICIVYFKDSYLPPRRKYSKRDLSDYQPKSGTGIAYKYAVQKKRSIINLAEQLFQINGKL